MMLVFRVYNPRAPQQGAWQHVWPSYQHKPRASFLFTSVIFFSFSCSATLLFSEHSSCYGPYTRKYIKKDKAVDHTDTITVQKALEKLHLERKEKSKKTRNASVDSHDHKTDVRTEHCWIGHFVLKSVVNKDREPKYTPSWTEKFLITEFRDEYIFRVENLSCKKTNFSMIEDWNVS